MSNNNQDWYDDFEDDFLEDDLDEQQAPQRRSSGDDVVKKLRRSDRAKEKRIKELESELGSLRKNQRELSVKSVLENKGISPKIAAFIPQDMDVNSTEFDSWLNEYSDVFGVSTASEEGEGQPGISQEDLATLRQMDVVTSGALSPDREEDLMLRLSQASSTDDILSMIYGT
jgi:hypothetical protein